MIHLTLNTGHARQSPREEVSDETIATYPPWCAVVIVDPPATVGHDWIGDFERCLAWAWLEPAG